PELPDLAFLRATDEGYAGLARAEGELDRLGARLAGRQHREQVPVAAAVQSVLDTRRRVFKSRLVRERDGETPRPHRVQGDGVPGVPVRAVDRGVARLAGLIAQIVRQGRLGRGEGKRRGQGTGGRGDLAS